MSEPIAEPPDPATDPPALPTAEPARRRQLFPALAAAGFLVLAAGLIWVWQHPAVPPISTEPTEAVARHLGALEARLTRVEQRPLPHNLIHQRRHPRTKEQTAQQQIRPPLSRILFIGNSRQKNDEVVD